MTSSLIMPIHALFDSEHNLIFSKAWGVVDSEAFFIYQSALCQHPLFDPSSWQLSDYLEVSRFDVELDQIWLLAERTAFSPESRRAFVIKPDHYALLRTYHTMLPSLGITLELFESHAAALQWLNLPESLEVPDPRVTTHLPSIGLPLIPHE